MNQIILNKYFFLIYIFSVFLNASTPPVDSIKINKWKSQISIGVNNNSKLAQEIVDLIMEDLRIKAISIEIDKMNIFEDVKSCAVYLEKIRNN